MRRPSPATVIACLALFFAIAGGSAIALQGRNSVDSGDIKKGQVKTSDLRKNAVTTRKIKNNAVRTGDIRDGQVGRADLTPAEAIQLIGTAVAPFGNGGQDDCRWSKLINPGGDFLPDPGYYKDPYDVVRLTGGVISTDGPSGDGLCDNDDDFEDARIFTLPPGYRPAASMLIPVFTDIGTEDVRPLIIVGEAGITTPTQTIPPGTVYMLDAEEPGSEVMLDGVSFRAAGTGNPAQRRGVVRDAAQAPRYLGG